MARAKKIITGPLIISNASSVPRGLMLKKGILLIQPGEVKQIPPEIEDEVRGLFNVPAVAYLFDQGLLRTDAITPNTPLKNQETPKPPASLDLTVPVPGSGLVVGANNTTQFNPNSATPLRADGSVTV